MSKDPFFDARSEIVAAREKARAMNKPKPRIRSEVIEKAKKLRVSQAGEDLQDEIPSNMDELSDIARKYADELGEQAQEALNAFGRLGRDALEIFERGQEQFAKVIEQSSNASSEEERANVFIKGVDALVSDVSKEMQKSLVEPSVKDIIKKFVDVVSAFGSFVKKAAKFITSAVAKEYFGSKKDENIIDREAIKAQDSWDKVKYTSKKFKKACIGLGKKYAQKFERKQQSVRSR